jgi:hypothetical protein
MKTPAASSRSAARGAVKKPRTAKSVAKTITAEEFDALVDSGADMTPYVDWSKARRPGREVQRVNVDFPVDLLRAIDREARCIGVTCRAALCRRFHLPLGRIKNLG